MVVAPFAVTLTMWTVKENALNEERARGRDADLRTGFIVAFAQYVTKTRRLKKRTCGKLWGHPVGDRGRSKDRRRSRPLHLGSAPLCQKVHF